MAEHDAEPAPGSEPVYGPGAGHVHPPAGAEPVYGPAASTSGNTIPADGTGVPAEHSGNQAPDNAAVKSTQALPLLGYPGGLDASSPPYTAPYPPYPDDTPPTAPITPYMASALAYVTFVPAVIFLLLEPYRSNAQVRFHSWQSILYFIAAAGARALEQLFVSLLPSALAFFLSFVLTLVFFAFWVVAVLKAFNDERWLLPVIGPYAERVAASSSRI